MIMKINYPIISVLFAYPLINCPVFLLPEGALR